MAFTLTSNSFKDGDYLAMTHVGAPEHGFGCTGENKSPHLKWTAGPEGTKSFAVTVFDPDAPTGSGFWHWLVVNIPPDVTELALGAGAVGGAALPKGALQTRGDYGFAGYGGPCPPPGHHPHRYIFTVYAVNEVLGVKEDTPAAQIGFNLHYKQLAKATLMGLFKR